MEPSLVGLRVLREVAERGSFTAAAASLGYTQSAVSRQVATLERAAGRRLFDRGPGGVVPTAAGQVLLRHGAVALDAVDAAGRELDGAPRRRRAVRLGAFASAGAAIVPGALAALRSTDPTVEVSTREGSSPGLVRSLRAGSIDLALLALSPPFRLPDAGSPALDVEQLAERPLLVAVPAADLLAARSGLRLADLSDLAWIASRSTGDETLLGVWPGLPGRPRVAHTARDWLAKLHLVAAGCGVTTVPAFLAPAVPAGVRLLPVLDGPRELRRTVLARLPGPPARAVAALSGALRAAAG